mgnify:CR=1 FL=1
MRTVALICAAGSQERWERSGGKGRKQLIEIDGEPIIRRLYRLASLYADEIVTLVRDPSDPCWEGLNPQRPAHKKWMGDLGKFLDGRPYWPQEGRVVVLYGDAYYSEDTVRTIFEHAPDQPTVYGRAQKGRSESFGFAFRVPQDVAEVERICLEVCKHPSLIKRGGPWRFFWHRHTGGTKYTKRERRKLTSLATPENGWIEVGHDDTDDFDTSADLSSWRARHRRNAKVAA